MYTLVDEAEAKRYRSACANILTQTRDTLNQEYEINTQFTLVGSGARNLITRNGNGPYDLDYNLQIISMPQKYWDDLNNLKETVRRELNQAVGGTYFSDGHDSTSVLTSNLHFNDSPNLEFSFDIAILGKNSNGDWCRLIHNKNQWSFGLNGQFTWREVPSSKNVYEKAREIKAHGAWLQVREKYVDLKNMYLERGDTNHPSFVCYVEAVNEVHQRLFRNGGKRR